MSNNDTRQMTIFIIWSAFFATLFTALTLDVPTGSRGFFLISFAVFFAGAAGATWAVWKYGSSDTSENAKRRSQVKHLLENMDEADLDELHRRIISESNRETIDLSELLTVQERQRR